MLDPMQKQRYQERFATVESSFRLEDMDPGNDEIYRDAKAQVLAGTMTPKQALAYVLQASAEHFSVYRSSPWGLLT
jgi:hypothetical protein